MRWVFVICAAILAVAAYADWILLDPVGGEDPTVVGSGGCGTRCRGYTFVAIGGEDGNDTTYAFN